jgi:hypothetical protein
VNEQEPIHALDRLRDELIRSASEHPEMAEHWAPPEPGRSRHGARRPIGGWLAAAAAVAVAIVIAVGAVILGDHHHAAVRSAARPITCQALLLDELQVLRRPQTDRDRAFHPPPYPVQTHGRAGFPYTPVPALTRLARMLPGGSRLFLGVYAPRPASDLAPLGDTVYLFYVNDRGQAQDAGSQVSALSLGSGYLLPPQVVGHNLFSLVPDGVTRVRWTFDRVLLVARPRGGKPIFRLHVGTVTARVEGNVAAAYGHGDGLPIPTITRWLNARGRTIRIYRGPTPRPPKVQSGTIVTSSPGIATGVVSPNGSCELRSAGQRGP